MSHWITVERPGGSIAINLSHMATIEILDGRGILLITPDGQERLIGASDPVYDQALIQLHRFLEGVGQP